MRERARFHLNADGLRMHYYGRKPRILDHDKETRVPTLYAAPHKRMAAGRHTPALLQSTDGTAQRR